LNNQSLSKNFSLGAVVHKLIRHQTAIVSVALTTDGSIAITGERFFQLIFIELRTWVFSASSDGLLSAWSKITGLILTTFHFNQNLVKLLVSQSGGRD
jgi:hypothetical protein